MIPEKIKEFRLDFGLTQKELAEKIGSTSKNIWAYENNIATPPIDVLINLSNFFRCSIDYLVDREDDFGNITISPTPTAPALTEKEEELLECFRSLSPYLQGMAIETLQTWAAKPGANAATKKKQA